MVFEQQRPILSRQRPFDVVDVHRITGDVDAVDLRVGEVVQSLKAFDRNKVALEIGGLVFFYAELESCVRLD